MGGLCSVAQEQPRPVQQASCCGSAITMMDPKLPVRGLGLQAAAARLSAPWTPCLWPLVNPMNCDLPALLASP